ncbi:MaoC family dehydratase [Nocardioides sp. AN3]
MAFVEEQLAAGPRRLGVTQPLEIGQDRIDRFAEATGDDQWIHVDGERAANGPFGTTIAHGFLTLSLTASMVAEVWPVETAQMTVNYGLDRVRFPAPLPAGSSVIGFVDLLESECHPRGVRSRVRVEVTAIGSDKPCCIAELVVLHENGRF